MARFGWFRPHDRPLKPQTSGQHSGKRFLVKTFRQFQPLPFFFGSGGALSWGER